jgi:hypothetical protein
MAHDHLGSGTHSKLGGVTSDPIVVVVGIGAALVGLGSAFYSSKLLKRTHLRF